MGPLWFQWKWGGCISNPSAAMDPTVSAAPPATVALPNANPLNALLCHLLAPEEKTEENHLLLIVSISNERHYSILHAMNIKKAEAKRNFASIQSKRNIAS